MKKLNKISTVRILTTAAATAMIFAALTLTGCAAAQDGGSGNNAAAPQGGLLDSLFGSGSQTSFIGIDKAKEIALNHAGVSAADARFEDREFDLDDGTPLYELEFRANGIEYEYDIDARDGSVVKAKSDRDDDYPKTDDSKVDASAYIGIDRAKEIALAHAGVDAADARFEDREFDLDDGTPLYELEFHANGIEYEYDIDARDGSVVKAKTDRDDDYPRTDNAPSVSVPTTDDAPVVNLPVNSTPAVNVTDKNPDVSTPVTDNAPSVSTPSANDGKVDAPEEYIGSDRAKEIALNHAGVSANDVRFADSEFDIDDGRAIYELEFYANGYEYEYDIDAVTGKILDWEKDRDD